MKLIEAIKLGFAAYDTLEQLKKAAPEAIDVVTKGQSTLAHVFTIYDDGKMTVSERDQAAANVESIGTEMAQLIRALPASDEPVVAPTN
jgi:hypothetical protein